MLRDTGLPLATGDRIAIYKTKWKVFPLGEKKGWKRTFLRRYAVTEDGGLSLLANTKRDD